MGMAMRCEMPLISSPSESVEEQMIQMMSSPSGPTGARGPSAPSRSPEDICARMKRQEA